MKQSFPPDLGPSTLERVYQWTGEQSDRLAGFVYDQFSGNRLRSGVVVGTTVLALATAAYQCGASDAENSSPDAGHQIVLEETNSASTPPITEEVTIVQETTASDSPYAHATSDPDTWVEYQEPQKADVGLADFFSGPYKSYTDWLIVDQEERDQEGDSLENNRIGPVRLTALGAAAIPFALTIQSVRFWWRGVLNRRVARLEHMKAQPNNPSQ